ncbi:hypothetical protein GCM10010345_85980 [Streptomyces canarius]|uniref:Uncharacterized protein n=1 Tax=Streptomyces canarius TaxID=285453 RepID=A0ABQ3D9K3_9ACTN|nr:hypothetical protein GCM10010345_85980 [Streptomyces canarius]
MRRDIDVQITDGAGREPTLPAVRVDSPGSRSLLDPVSAPASVRKPPTRPTAVPRSAARRMRPLAGRGGRDALSASTRR